MLHQLGVAIAPLPAGTTGPGVLAYPTTWQTPCAGQPGHAGWPTVRATKTFARTAPQAPVARQINAQLAPTGWVKANTAPARGQGPLLRWVKRMPAGSVASVFAFPERPGGTTWFLSASWNPPGVATGGC